MKLMEKVETHIWPSIVFLGLFTVLLGLVYPGLVTLILQNTFAKQANGSLIYQQNALRGSILLGQSFSEPRYFWGRLSATTPSPYNSESSGGSNFSTTNPELIKSAKARIDALQKDGSTKALLIPVDLITASGSGLDPDISIASAIYQASRIAHARQISEEIVLKLVTEMTISRQWGILGEPRVNVVALNLKLDALVLPKMT